MAKQPVSSRDVDLLMLIREEEVYAARVKSALVVVESRIQRAPAPSVELDQTRRERRREKYMKPESATDLNDQIESTLPLSKKPCSQTSQDARPIVAADEPRPYINPPINRRNTVDDNDALFSESGSSSRSLIPFTYEDLVLTREGKKTTTVRALRKLANLWMINGKLNKQEMLLAIIEEYIGRYPDEVEAYEKRRSTTRPGKMRRRPKRR